MTRCGWMLLLGLTACDTSEPMPGDEPDAKGGVDATVDTGSGCECEASECEATTDAGQGASGVRQPEYTADGALKRPAGTEQWVFMGSGVNLNYVPGDGKTALDVMTVTLMEPTAYRHFQQTGTFAEGTMTALYGFVAGTGAPPAEHGQYLGNPLFFEMSVKDSAVHGEAVWGYYDIGPTGETASAKPESECNACHADNAETDFVFTQFYPFMRE